jgi:hypothetical protein
MTSLIDENIKKIQKHLKKLSSSVESSLRCSHTRVHQPATHANRSIQKPPENESHLFNYSYQKRL